MEKKQVFEGIKVADFSWAGVGPMVVRELAEHGATVVHVESHKVPGLERFMPPYKDFETGIDRSAFVLSWNTNKLGISLDLNNPKSQEVAKRLVNWADIVTDSMSPGTMAKWGLDYESVRKMKPDIIYYSATLAGQYGPYAKFQAYGPQGAAITGLYSVTGWPDREPVCLYGAYTDYIAPFFLVCALVAALDYRRRTGKGIYLDTSQWEAAINFLGPAVLDYAVNGRIAMRMGNRSPHAAPHGVYQCMGTERWVVIAVRTDEEWKAFCKVIGEPEWTMDSKFTTFLGRKENEDELDRLVGEWTIYYTPEDVMFQMQAAGVPAGVVQNSQDLFEDPQVKHRRHFQWLNHQVIGSVVHNAPAYWLSKTPSQLVKALPCLGGDNEHVYKEILGYSDDEIADMLVEGVITTEADLPDYGL
jgi:benzylsuccinate CoA-transferase BbsF subunit